MKYTVNFIINGKTTSKVSLMIKLILVLVNIKIYLIITVNLSNKLLKLLSIVIRT